MPHGVKIATCCYCGTRAALVLRGRERRELACAGCGAPLQDLKQMPAPQQPGPTPVRARTIKGFRRDSRKPRRSPRKKSLFRKVVGEAFDLIEDILD